MSLIGKATQSIAQAEAQEPGQQLELYKSHLQAITEQYKVDNQKNDPNKGRVEPVASKWGH